MWGRHSKLEHNGTNSIFHKQKRRQTERFKHRRKTVRKRDREKVEREKDRSWGEKRERGKDKQGKQKKSLC